MVASLRRSSIDRNHTK